MKGERGGHRGLGRRNSMCKGSGVREHEWYIRNWTQFRMAEAWRGKRWGWGQIMTGLVSWAPESEGNYKWLKGFRQASDIVQFTMWEDPWWLGVEWIRGYNGGGWETSSGRETTELCLGLGNSSGNGTSGRVQRWLLKVELTWVWCWLSPRDGKNTSQRWRSFLTWATGEMRVLFSEMNNTGRAGLWEDDVFKLRHVQFNFLPFQYLLRFQPLEKNTFRAFDFYGRF